LPDLVGDRRRRGVLRDGGQLRGKPDGAAIAVTICDMATS
jgi:hypothetical protein